MKRGIILILLVAAFFVMQFFESKFTTALTVRNISSPTGIYQYAWTTHGGVVFLSKQEWMIVNYSWVPVVGTLLLAVVLSALFRRTNKGKP